MTRRATFTQAELVRRIKAASTVGKVVLEKDGGFYYLNPADVPKSDKPSGSDVDGWFEENGEDQD